MRPVEEQITLVTGATDGLGRALAGELAARGATVLVHGRSPERVDGVVQDLGNERGRGYVADFSALDQVRALAEAIERDHRRLDLLVNNAGIGSGPRGSPREVSEDGYELRFAVNYLAPFLLTNLLLPLLRRSAPSRIVNVASVGQAPIDFDDVMLEREYSGMRAYAQSKLAQITFTFELADRLRAEGADVTANALHPATLMNTKMVDESFGYTQSTIEEGVEATLRLAISPELDRVSGRYFDRLHEAQPNEQATETEARRRLWALSEELAELDVSARSA
jgi:NAD(P)-dependent dehydrogenase (short-subunit alcohol dehydrogenase family)